MRSIILTLFAIFFLLSSVVIILGFFKVSSLYPLSDVNLLRARIKNYELQNKVVNPQEFSYIKEECNSLRKKLSKQYNDIGFLKFFSAVSLFIASILLFISKKPTVKLDIKGIDDIEDKEKH